MPWTETLPMEERYKFVLDYKSGTYFMNELCERYGISRPTGYKWLRRFAQEGLEGLADQPRIPRFCPHRMRLEVQQLLLEIKRAHPSWGAKKLLHHLTSRRPDLVLPARSTVDNLLDQHGLVQSRPRRRRWEHPGRPVQVPTGPNQIWTADFKGQFRTQDGVYCYPLTVADLYSRYLLECRALPSVRGEGAQPALERIFREVGLPNAIRTDNGAPFTSTTAIHGLCELNVWWLKLGIQHQRIQPGCPSQNGAHERMHRTLKAETTRPPRRNLRRQQILFDRWVADYNQERPHEALDGQTPASAWVPSNRPYPTKLPEPDYPGHYLKRKISSFGAIRLFSKQIFLSHAIRGEYVGLEEVDDGVWSIYFYRVLLARLDERAGRLVP